VELARGGKVNKGKVIDGRQGKKKNKSGGCIIGKERALRRFRHADSKVRGEGGGKGKANWKGKKRYANRQIFQSERRGGGKTRRGGRGW